jgi:8-oxo-dGTP pyrophosphatase MutT (NUDIX family)
MPKVSGDFSEITDGFLDHIQRHNNFDASQFVPWSIAGTIAEAAASQPVGWLHRGHLPWLAANQQVLQPNPDSGGGWQLDPTLTTSAARSNALNQLAIQLHQHGLITHWYDEQVSVVTDWGQPPLATASRASIGFLGIKAFGVHLNAYHGYGDQMQLWIARRAAHLANFPNQYDHLVAGGVAAGDSIVGTLIKEAQEEAGMPMALSQAAQPVGAIRYHLMRDGYSRQDTVFVYDLAMDRHNATDFVPVNEDGHVASFDRYPVDRVMHLVAHSNEVKSNVNLVLIDFFLRHGMIAADDPAFVALLMGLRSP